MGCVLSALQICLPENFYDPDDEEKKVVYANTDQDYGQKLTGTGTWTSTYVVQPGGQARRRSMLIFPPTIDGVPEGFETFVELAHFFVQKNHPFYRIMTNFKNKTSYTVQNKKAEYMLFASQEVASLTVGEQCLELCNNYPYVLHVSDNCEREVMRIKKKAKCNGFLTCLGCSHCGANECTVECPPGEKLGTITQRRSFCAYSFTIRDEKDDLLYEVEGPCFLLDYLYCGRRTWSIRNGFGLKVAAIEKVWVKNGNNPEHRNEAYEISCPKGLAVKRKALFLATAFFLDSISY